MSKKIEKNEKLDIPAWLYPKYFQGTEERDCIVVFPCAGSMGTAYYLKPLNAWSAEGPQWNLRDMRIEPKDVEISRKQAKDFGVPVTVQPTVRAETEHDIYGE